MKKHISITLEDKLADQARRFAREEHRSVSQVVEMALAEYLRDRYTRTGGVVTSAGVFRGRFERADTYANR